MRKRILVVLALATLVVLSIPRYVDGLSAGDYGQAGQMVALVWFGFFAAARYWLGDDARFGRIIVGVSALICVPSLLYHLYDSRHFAQGAGTSFLLLGILVFTYGFLVRRERIVSTRSKQQKVDNS